MTRRLILAVLAPVLACGASASDAAPDRVLVVVNKRSPASQEIADYYVQKRHIPPGNVCRIDTEDREMISRKVYDEEVEGAIARCLRPRGLAESIYYIALTKGVPLKMWAENGKANDLGSDGASVDSELTLLYQRLKGAKPRLDGPIDNPFFRQRDTPFRHPLFPMYLVTRLDAYNVAEVKAMIDRGLQARNAGKFAIDLRGEDSTPGNEWLRTAALLLPRDRVVIEETAAVLGNVKDVIGYASWGSNDPARKRRVVNLKWLPGGIATEFVSTDARTFHQPPAAWEIGPWSDKSKWFEGAPQTLSADYIHEGASGASGQAIEPYLGFCPRPDFVLPAYYSGRNLAESFYMGIPGVSWMNVVIGDPLMRLEDGPPR